MAREMLSRGTVVTNPSRRDWQRNPLLSTIFSWPQVIPMLDVNMPVMDTKIGEMIVSILRVIMKLVGESNQISWGWAGEGEMWDMGVVGMCIKDLWWKRKNLPVFSMLENENSLQNISTTPTTWARHRMKIK